MSEYIFRLGVALFSIVGQVISMSVFIWQFVVNIWGGWFWFSMLSVMGWGIVIALLNDIGWLKEVGKK